MRVDRRTFLQQASLALLALGISDPELSLLGDHGRLAMLKRYSQSLAEPTARKLALLVGINEYPQELYGCLTDVQLQQELLVHRFGFQPQDIITLTNQQATWENIITAFREHLLQQAKFGDVVVFHFSGYGSQVKMASEELSPPKLANCLVVQDDANSQNNYLLTDTLLSLGRSLPTNKLTMVLDTSYQGKENLLLVRGLRVRSFPTEVTNQISSQKLALLEELSHSLQTKRVKKNQIPGIILTAAKESQLATEGKWQSFSAGLFTYALTQYLWQVTPASTIQVSLGRAAERLERTRGLLQKPQIEGNHKQSLFTYYLFPENQIGAEGLITLIEETGNINLKLLGFPASLLENYGNNSCFTVVSPTTAQIVSLQIQTREGLNAKAQIMGENITSLATGQLIQEYIRVLPRHLGLTVALDNNLSRIERVDATSALSSISVVSSVVNVGEQNADLCFGKVKDGEFELTKREETKETYALFTLGGVPLANSTGLANEAVKSIVKRLENQLETSLAAKLWRLTENDASSRLGVRATLENVNVEADHQPSLLLQRETPRFPEMPTVINKNNNLTGVKTESSLFPRVKLGTRIQYRLENYADYPVYFFLIGTNANGQAIAFNPVTDENLIIPAGETLIFPEQKTSSNWIVAGSVGLVDLQLIFSRFPFARTWQSLTAITNKQEKVAELIQISHALPIAKSLLEDLHNTELASELFADIMAENYILDVKNWATFNFLYRVV